MRITHPQTSRLQILNKSEANRAGMMNASNPSLMKTNLISVIIIAITVLSPPPLAYGQGTLIYDQQSANENRLGESGGFLQTGQPFGQSFTPTLSSIDFIRLLVSDVLPGNGLGATVSINLRSNSITGPIMEQTIPVVLPDGFGVGHTRDTLGFINFFFAADVSLTPGVIYYFQPVVASGGDTWVAVGDNMYAYLGGTLFVNGRSPQFGNFDLWFREGIYVVREPSSALLVLLGGGAIAWRHLKSRRNR